MRTWNSLIERVGLEVKKYASRHNVNGKKRGLIVVHINLIMDGDNRPLHWIISSKSIEPAAYDDDFIKSFIVDAT